MVLEGFSGVLVFRLSALLYRDFDNVSDGLDLGHSWQPKKMLRKVSVRNRKFMEGKSQELAKPR